MAYADVTSLYHTIDHLLRSSLISSDKSPPLSSSLYCCSSDVFLHIRTYLRSSSSTEELLTSARRCSRHSRNMTSIRTAAAASRPLRPGYGTRPAESSAAAQFLSQHESKYVINTAELELELSLDLNHLKSDIDLFLKRSKQLGAEYLKELNKPPPPASAVAVVAAVVVSPEADDMVGLSDLFIAIRQRLTTGWGEGRRFSSFIISGMAGSGKTALMKRVFNDPSVEGAFERRAFVRVGQRYDYIKVLVAIAAQLNTGCDGMAIGGAESVIDYFKRSLSLRGKGRFLIVLDDVWNNVWDSVSHQNLLGMVPKGDCDGCVFITSRLQNAHIVSDVGQGYGMRFLTKEESWELLQRKVFGEDGECPPPLVKAEKKIAENCEGLPLLILSVGEVMSEAEASDMTPKYWKEVAEMKNSVFEDAMDRIYDVLVSSYDYLDQCYKACFLYMGAFPKDHVFRRSSIVNFWRAERITDEVDSVLYKLIASNLVLSRGRCESTLPDLARDKAFKLHVVYRYLTKRVGEQVGFLLILSTYEGMIDERLNGKRHLAVHHNSLLGMKEVQRSIASPLASNIRSVLCTGPYHCYQVPVCPELKLVRVLEAITSRFYEFPVELVELVLLRYLSLTTNANLPASVNKLRFLRFLILHQHSIVVKFNQPSYLPVEIWDLEELEHLEIVGRNLPDPPRGFLPNLKRLLDAGHRSFTRGVLDCMPNLDKLRIQIELEPHFDPRTIISCFQKLYCLTKLRSLQFVVTNPVILPKPAVPPRFLSYPIATIRKLSLSGFGYPWADLSIVSKIAYLYSLKLKCYAFCLPICTGDSSR